MALVRTLVRLAAAVAALSPRDRDALPTRILGAAQDLHGGALHVPEHIDALLEEFEAVLCDRSTARAAPYAVTHAALASELVADLNGALTWADLGTAA